MGGGSYRSLINTLATEVVFLNMPSRNRKKRSKQRAEYLQKQDNINHQKRTRLNPSALSSESRNKDTKATMQILNLSDMLKDSDINRTSRRTVLLKDSDINRTLRRTVLLKGSDIKESRCY